MNSGIEEEVPLVSEEQVLAFHTCGRQSCILYYGGEVASFFGHREENRLKVSGTGFFPPQVLLPPTESAAGTQSRREQTIPVLLVIDSPNTLPSRPTDKLLS